jgi:hypothetical protein
MLTLAGLAAVGAYLGRPYPLGPGVCWANVDRIAVGMTAQEVQAIVGRPPQSWWRGPKPITDHSPPGYHKMLMWSDQECDILVYLDRNGRVMACEGVGGQRPSWFDRICHRLGLESGS